MMQIKNKHNTSITKLILVLLVNFNKEARYSTVEILQQCLKITEYKNTYINQDTLL